jgi:hypothetical protein
MADASFFNAVKKLAGIAGFALFAIGAFAQGSIVFANSASTLVRTNDGVSSGPVVVGRVMLFYSTAPSAPAVPGPANGYSFAPWTQTTSTTGSTAADFVGSPLPLGRFAGGTQIADTAAGNSSPWVFVVGWTGTHADFSTALSAGAFVGFSPTWQQPTGSPFGDPLTPAQAMILGASGFNGLQLVPIPEPSTLALAGCGAAILIVFRRR